MIKKILFLLFLNHVLLAEETGILLFNHTGEYETAAPEVRSTIDAAADTLETAFAAVGLRITQRIVNTDSGEVSVDSLQAACAAAGVRWGVSVFTNLTEGRFSWRFGIYDTDEKTFRGEDSFAVYLYAGLSARNAVESSARAVAGHWQKSFLIQEFGGAYAVATGQAFLSSQEGVNVYYGDETGVYLGKTLDGGLTAPLFLFERGAPVYGILTKKGYWTKPFTLKQGVSDAPFRLPVLQKVTHHTVGFLTEIGSPERYGIDLEYRYQFVPDRLFIKLDLLLWMNGDFSEQNRFLNPELRFGFGLYLLPKRDLPVRLLVGIEGAVSVAGYIAIYPPEEGEIVRLSFNPVWLGFEYHFPQAAIVTQFRFPGLWKTDNWPVTASIGVLLKW